LESGKTALLLLQEQILAVQSLQVERPSDVMSKARTIGYLISLGMHVLEVAQLETRLTQLETEFHDRLYSVESGWKKHYGESEN
jgi:hypothetical protein